MPLLETFALNIGAAVAKFLIETYWGKNAATTAAGKAFEVAASQILSRKPKDKNIEDVASQIALRLSELLKAERVSDEDRERLALEIALTLDEAKITSKLLVECNLDYTKLSPHLETARPDATKLLSDGDTAIYNRMLREACEAILNLAVTMAGLDRHYKAATLQDLDQLKYLFAKLLEREDERATLFEKRYRADVETVLDWMDIFGVPKAKEFERRLSLTTIYLTLEAEWEEERERDEAQRFLNVEVRDDEGEKRIEHYAGSVDKLLEKNRRLVIEGNAGSGKTTLLRWLAVKTAKKELQPSLADWNETTPFYIPLREYVNKTPPFPNIEDFIRLDTSGKPETWVRDRLEKGRALVLIDGVDEMPNEQRGAMWESIARLVKQFPFTYYVISSRPYALRSEENKSWLDWFAQENFVLASLKPMTRDKVETFVRYWHEALRKFARSEHEREVMERNTTNLITTFNRNLPLRQLAETPLLCAMICAMHQSVDQKVPSNRIDLYQTCIDMMLSKRDDARDIDSLVKLDPRQKWDLAKGFAYKLMLNDLSDVEVEEAQNYFARRLSEMRLTEPADKVLRDFIDRANLLREPTFGRVEFMHRTFQEFLTAQEVMEENDVGFLADCALKDGWRETILLAAGASLRQKDLKELLKKLIAKGDEVSDEGSKRLYYLLALACSYMSVRLDDSQLQELVLSKVTTILPPQTEDEAKLVAYASDPVVPFLSDNAKREPEEVKLCIDTLALIGTDNAMNAISDYAAHYVSDTEAEIQIAIGNAWANFDSTVYIERVFTRTPIVYINSGQASHADALKGLLHLTTLDIGNIGNMLVNVSNAPQDFKAVFSDITSTEIMDISPLFRLPNLTVVRINNTGSAAVNMEKGLSNLAALTFNNTGTIYVSVLEDIPNLATLMFNNSGNMKVGAVKGLQHLDTITFNNSGDIAIGEVESLPNLAALIFNNGGIMKVGTVKDLKRLTGLHLNNGGDIDIGDVESLPNLAALIFNNTGNMKVSAVKDLKRLTALHLNNGGDMNVSALDNLPNLVTLDFNNIHGKNFNVNFSNISRDLKNLYFSNTKISNLIWLRDLKNLELLQFNNVLVNDLNVLKDVKGLAVLRLSSTPVGDMSVLKDLPNLRELYLDNTQVSDVSALKDTKGLEELNLANTLVSDVSALKGLPNLRKLYLSNTQVSDVSTLKDTKGLEELNLASTLVSDVSALKGLPNLRKLYLDNTQVSDVSALKDLKSLERLYLDNTPVNDVSALKDLLNLKTLSLSNTPVSDVSSLKELKGVEQLNLYNTRVSDASALKDLLNLQMLTLADTLVSDMSALKDLPNLKELYLANTPVSNVMVLKGLKQLQKLSLDGTQVSDISLLKDLPNLKALSLNNTKVSDVSMLKDLLQLRELHINDTLVTDVSMKTLKEVNKDLKIYFSERKLENVAQEMKGHKKS